MNIILQSNNLVLAKNRLMELLYEDIPSTPALDVIVYEKLEEYLRHYYDFDVEFIEELDAELNVRISNFIDECMELGIAITQGGINECFSPKVIQTLPSFIDSTILDPMGSVLIALKSLEQETLDKEEPF